MNWSNEIGKEIKKHKDTKPDVRVWRVEWWYKSIGRHRSEVRWIVNEWEVREMEADESIECVVRVYEPKD